MAVKYLYSGATGAADGSDWTNAYTTATAAVAGLAAGDTLFVANDHAESTAGAVTITFPGTLAAPNLCLCVNRAGSVPPVSADLTTGGQVTTTGTNALSIAGYVYIRGMRFNAGTGAGQTRLFLGSEASNTSVRQIYDTCVLNNPTTHISSGILARSDGALTGETEIINCQFGYGNASQFFMANGTKCTVKGGSALAGTTSPASPWGANSCKHFTVDGFDHSGWSGMTSLLRVNAGTAHEIRFRNGKLAGALTTLLSSAPALVGTRGEMYNVDAADTNYKIWVQDVYAVLRDEVTVVKTGGASDGTTPISWKVVTVATNPNFPVNSFRCPVIVSPFISTVGSPLTLTVDIIHDSVTALNDNQIWADIQYLGTSGFPLALFANDAPSDVLATAAAQTASTATWTTTGLTNPNKQKLTVSFTPQEQGVALITVHVAVASKTLYIDPVAQIA